MTSFIRISQKLMFHQSKCICAIKRILSTTAMYVSWSSFMYLRISCYCDACLNSSDLFVGVTTLLNTIQFWNSASAQERDFTAQMVWWHSVPSPRGGFGGLSFPQTKPQASQFEVLNTPLHRCKTPLLKTFWRRF